MSRYRGVSQLHCRLQWASLGVKRPFSEQVSEVWDILSAALRAAFLKFNDPTQAMRKPILGAILGETPGSGGNPTHRFTQILGPFPFSFVGNPKGGGATACLSLAFSPCQTPFLRYQGTRKGQLAQNCPLFGCLWQLGWSPRPRKP